MNHSGRAVACLCISLLSACSRSAPEPARMELAAAAQRHEDGVTLAPAEIANLGVAVAPAAAAIYHERTAGYGVVVARDVIAQALTGVIAAQAAKRQSYAVLARMQRLAGTLGADSAAARETAERQAVADDAALDLAEAKASSVLGQQSPWTGGKSPELIRALAADRIKILRVTFPLGNFTVGVPQNLRVARLDAQAGDSPWRTTASWPAPADNSIPGRSYFAILEKSNVNEGERLLAWATDETSRGGRSGAFIPASALIIADGKYWCYLQRESGRPGNGLQGNGQRQNDTFVRTPMDISRPQPGGYFTAGIKPGDAVVTSGAGLLLARETNPATGTDP